MQLDISESTRFRSLGARSSIRAVLGTLQPRACWLLNRVDSVDSLSSYYNCLYNYTRQHQYKGREDVHTHMYPIADIFVGGGVLNFIIFQGPVSGMKLKTHKLQLVYRI